MNRNTYVDIYNLITDTLGHHESRVEDYLRAIDDYEEEDGADTLAFLVRKVKKHRAKIKELNDLLERFENEVDEPAR